MTSSILTTKTLGIVVGIAGVSAIGGGIAYGAGLLNDSKPEQKEIVLTNNRTKLSDQGFLVLNKDSSDDEWEKVFAVYKKAQKGTFKGTGVADTEKTKPKLIQECQRQLALDTAESYKLTRQWCVKQEIMATILGRKSKVLITDESKDTDNSKWETKIKNLTPSDKASLSISESSPSITTIKSKCKAITDKKTTDAEFNEKFEIAKRVCTI